MTDQTSLVASAILFGLVLIAFAWSAWRARGARARRERMAREITRIAVIADRSYRRRHGRSSTVIVRNFPELERATGT